MKQIIIGISGASGAVYGVRLLELLAHTPGVNTHCVLTPAAEKTLKHELDMDAAQVRALAGHAHDARDIGASIASGSFGADAMIIAPCSMHTLAAVAHSLSSNLLLRAADVMLKERKKLILAARETPLHAGHIRAMLAVTEMGGIIAPPVPAFYAKPATLDDMVDHTAMRLLGLAGITLEGAVKWQGLDHKGAAA